MLEALYPLHPRAVHFPIALSLAGVLFVILGAAMQRDRWLGYGRMSLFLGWLGVMAAVISGLIDQSRAPDTADVTAVINQHITAGIGLIVVQGVTLWWPLRNKRLLEARGTRWAYFGLLLIVVALIAVEGWLGGKLVYQFGLGVR